MGKGTLCTKSTKRIPVQIKALGERIQRGERGGKGGGNLDKKKTFQTLLKICNKLNLWQEMSGAPFLVDSKSKMTLYLQ